MFNHSEYSKTKVECPLCKVSYARGNAPKHKQTKRHKENEIELLNMLTGGEKDKLKEIVSKINMDDLKKLLN